MAALAVVNGEDTKPFARVSRPPPRPQEVELILQRSYPPSFPRITSTTTMPYSAEQYAPANTFPTYITANLVIPFSLLRVPLQENHSMNRLKILNEAREVTRVTCFEAAIEFFNLSR